MNRVFVNTKAIEKQYRYYLGKNTCFIVNNKRNMQITTNIFFDNMNLYTLSKKKLAVINIKKSSKIIIQSCTLRADYKKESLYKTLKNSKNIKYKTRIKNGRNNRKPNKTYIGKIADFS